MNSIDKFGRPPETAREHHLRLVNDVIRRPGMHGRDELAERLLLEAMAAVDGSLEQWWAECEALRDRDAFTATGVMGAYSRIVPAEASRDAAASVYAEIAHRLGWLHLDRALSPSEFHRMSTDVDGWVSQDRTLTEVVETFGEPSVRTGPTGAEHPKTLSYTTADTQSHLISFHLGRAVPQAAPKRHDSDERPPGVVLAVRHRRDNFARAFSFTPTGMRRKPVLDRLTPTGAVVWIFHGEQARFASGVFTTMTAGLAWAAERRVTGTLAEYAIGGAYDVAFDEGRFRPSKAHHGGPEHVAGFGPGLQHVHLTDGRPD